MARSPKRRGVDWKEKAGDAVDFIGFVFAAAVMACICFKLTIFLTGFFPLWGAFLIAVPIALVLPAAYMILAAGATGFIQISALAFVLFLASLLCFARG